MPTARVKLPDGRVGRFAVPEGTAPDQVLSLVKAKNPELFATPSADPFDNPDLGGPRAAPKPAPLTTWDVAGPYVKPAIETAGLLAGGTVGMAGGPLTAVAGGALGYAGAKKATGFLDHYLGGQPLPQGVSQNALTTANDVMAGASMQMGGDVLGAAVAPVVGGVANALRPLKSGTSYARARAAKIVRAALSHLPGNQVSNALAAAQPGSTAGQALSGLNAPTYQALAREALKRDPEFTNLVKEEQDALVQDALASIARGGTATDVRAAAEQSKESVTNALVPVLKRELGAANTAGQKLPGLEREAARMEAAASNKVTDVGRFSEARDIATEASKTWRPSMMGGKGPTLPLPLRKYTYPAELAVRAEAMAQKSADTSLLFGESKRFAQAAADSLKAHGLEPLRADKVLAAVDRTLTDPSVMAGNKELQSAMTYVRQEVEKWTRGDGVIPAEALDSLRKNAINSVVNQFAGNAKPKAQRALAAAVLPKIKPLIIDAIEQAGGKDYGAYLGAYSDAMKQIAERKLVGRAAEIYKASPKKFVEMVRGGSPKEVEKILGPGQYDIAKEVSERTLDVLQSTARTVFRDIRIKGQANEGKAAAALLIEQNLPRMHIPGWFSPTITAANYSISQIEKRLGSSTIKIITEASKTPQGLQNLLNAVPPAQRSRIVRVLSDPAILSGAGRAAAAQATSVANQDQERRNALRD